MGIKELLEKINSHGTISQGIWLPWDLIPMGIQLYHKPIRILNIYLHTREELWAYQFSI